MKENSNENPDDHLTPESNEANEANEANEQDGATAGTSFTEAVARAKEAGAGRDSLESKPEAGESETREQQERRGQRMSDARDAALRAKFAAEGHGWAKHGAHITQQQLADRCMYGIDPSSGKKDNTYGKEATQVLSDQAFVRGGLAVSEGPAHEQARADAESDGRNLFEVRVPLEVLGPDFQQQIRGEQRIGSRKHPQGSTEVDFTDGMFAGRYKQSETGEWSQVSMFPDIARGAEVKQQPITAQTLPAGGNGGSAEGQGQANPHPQGNSGTQSTSAE